MARITMECNKTLGELIAESYPDYEIRYGDVPMDTDLSHGVEIETHDNREQGYGVTVNIYPFVLWTDGLYKPVHYWGADYEISLFKQH